MKDNYCPICHLRVRSTDDCGHAWAVMNGLVVIISPAKSAAYMTYLERREKDRIASLPKLIPVEVNVP